MTDPLTDIAWPETLPASPLVDGYQETLPQTVLRTEMDMGPAKTRRRTTAGVGQITVAYLLTTAETATLESFYRDTLAGGALPFAYRLPRGGGAAVCRFKKPPALVAVNGKCFRAVLELEVLP